MTIDAAPASGVRPSSDAITVAAIRPSSDFDATVEFEFSRRLQWMKRAQASRAAITISVLWVTFTLAARTAFAALASRKMAEPGLLLRASMPLAYMAFALFCVPRNGSVIGRATE